MGLTDAEKQEYVEGVFLWLDPTCNIWRHPDGVWTVRLDDSPALVQGEHLPELPRLLEALRDEAEYAASHGGCHGHEDWRDGLPDAYEEAQSYMKDLKGKADGMRMARFMLEYHLAFWKSADGPRVTDYPMDNKCMCGKMTWRAFAARHGIDDDKASRMEGTDVLLDGFNDYFDYFYGNLPYAGRVMVAFLGAWGVDVPDSVRESMRPVGLTEALHYLAVLQASLLYSELRRWAARDDHWLRVGDMAEAVESVACGVARWPSCVCPYCGREHPVWNFGCRNAVNNGMPYGDREEDPEPYGGEWMAALGAQAEAYRQEYNRFKRVLNWWYKRMDCVTVGDVERLAGRLGIDALVRLMEAGVPDEDIKQLAG